jgi:hypothetical protein
MMGGEKKSRDKSRYEEHQKLSCKISPLVFYFKANNKKMRRVAAITVPWRQGHTAPHPAKQTSEAARREICDDKETNDDAAKDKRVAECSLSSYFFQSTSWPQIQGELLYCSRMHAVSEYSLW